MRKIIFILALVIFISACKQKTTDYKPVINKHILNQCHDALKEGIIENHLTPPVAGRNYLFPFIAAYCAIEPFYEDYVSLDGKLKELSNLPTPEEGKNISHDLAAAISFLRVGEKMTFTPDSLNSLRTVILRDYKELLSKDVFDNSVAWGEKMGKYVLAWAESDGYTDIKKLPGHTPRMDGVHWEPTLPAQIPGVEPHWNKLRTLVIDSVNFYLLPRPTKVDFTKGSPFYKEMEEVYTVFNQNDSFRKMISEFWDCNPNIVHIKGHSRINTLKNSPGGHWMSIMRNVTIGKDLSLIESSRGYAMTGIAIHDAFLTCWDEKYRSDYIRPETVIRKYIDKDWLPHLQTPAFSEYPSGHSVVSASASRVLTDLYGEYKFSDSTEQEFGMPVRTFNNFIEASNEAAISRIYGGIHFMPAIDNGIILGVKVSEKVNAIKLKK